MKNEPTQLDVQINLNADDNCFEGIISDKFKGKL